MLRGTLICGRDGAVQTRSLCSWPTLVCTVRTLHKTGVPHPCLSPTGTWLMQQEASGRGQWAVCSAEVWCPGHGGLSHHRGPLGLGMGSSPGRHRFLSSLLSFLCFPGWHKSPSMLATAPRSQDPILVSPRPPKCCVMPTAQMGLTEPCQAGVSVSGLCQGRWAPLALQGTGGWHFPGWPQPEGGGTLLQLSAALGSPGLLPPTGVLRCPGGLVGLTWCRSILLAPRAGTPTLSHSPLSWRQRVGSILWRVPHPSVLEATQCNPVPGFPSPCWGPLSSGWL